MISTRGEVCAVNPAGEHIELLVIEDNVLPEGPKTFRVFKTGETISLSDWQYRGSVGSQHVFEWVPELWTGLESTEDIDDEL